MAKRFNFSLEKVLEVRQHLENQQAVKVFKTKAAFNSEEQKLKILKDHKHKAMEIRQHNSHETIINLNDLKVNHGYVTQLNRSLDQQGKKVEESGKKVKTELNKLNETVKDKKVVQKLKERHFEVHKKMMNQEYNKQQDEVAIRIVKGT